MGLPDKAEAMLKALEPWRNARMRPAWLPEVKSGPGPAAGSRFGGLPWLPRGESHPAYGNRKQPLRLLLQLELRALPAEGRGVSGLPPVQGADGVRVPD